MVTSARSKLNALKKVASQKFNSDAHPRYPAGHPLGGQFMPKNGGTSPIPLSVPSNRTIMGNKTTSLLELSAIGVDESGTLNASQLDRLHAIRNGKNSFEDFLASPPDIRDDSVLFAGERVQMSVTDSGSVGFSVDDQVTLMTKASARNKPSRELAEMQQVFGDYLKAPASDRVLSCNPIFDTKERFEARVKHYKKNGFVNVSELSREDNSDSNDDLMFLDNRRNPDTFIPIPDCPGISVRGTYYKFDADKTLEWIF